MAAPPGCSTTAVPELGHGAAVRAQRTLVADRWDTRKRQGQGEMQSVHPLGAGQGGWESQVRPIRAIKAH